MSKKTLEEEISYLAFWGRTSRETLMKMPIWKRRIWSEMTIKNVELAMKMNQFNL